MAIVRVKLSSSSNGQPIGLATGAATTIHTSTTAASTSDEVHIWYVNYSGSTVTVFTVLGPSGTQPTITVEVPALSGPFLVIPGLFLASGIVASAWAGTVGAISAYGFVNRLTTGA